MVPQPPPTPAPLKRTFSPPRPAAGAVDGSKPQRILPRGEQSFCLWKHARARDAILREVLFSAKPRALKPGVPVPSRTPAPTCHPLSDVDGAPSPRSARLPSASGRGRWFWCGALGRGCRGSGLGPGLQGRKRRPRAVATSRARALRVRQGTRAHVLLQLGPHLRAGVQPV